MACCTRCPSIALFIVLPAILGTQVLSTVNIIVALTIYTVSLLIRNVIDGLRSVPAGGAAGGDRRSGYGPLRPAGDASTCRSPYR